MSGPISSPGWYAICAAYLGTPVAVRRKVSRQTLATYWRIRRLPAEWGDALDARGAPLHVMRAIAWAQDDAERKRRFLEAIATWDEAARWPRWREIRGGASEGEERDAEERGGEE